MDSFNDPRVKRIVIMKPAQAGGTQTLFNMLGYIIDRDPGPIMWVQTTALEAKGFAKNRVASFLADNPIVGDKINKRASQLDEKLFPGGIVVFRGSRSAPPLRQRPIRYLFMDDVDGFAPTTSEGDPVKLARERLKTYAEAGISKEIMCSSPAPSSKNALGTSRIADEWEVSDKLEWYSQCPHCKEYHIQQWERVRWDHDNPRASDAWYEAPCCGVVWDEDDRRWAIMHGEWRSQGPAIQRGVRGFKWSELDIPFSSYVVLKEKWLDAEGNEDQEEVFYTACLARVVDRRVEKPDSDRLYERREDYPRGVVPARACVLTAGVDVQHDRVEVEIVAWGRGLESWSVDYLVLPGNPAHGASLAALAELLEQRWPHACGGPELRLEKIGVDTGFETQVMYRWWRTLVDRHRVCLMKGLDRNDTILCHSRYVDVHESGKRIKRGAFLWTIGVDAIKAEVYGMLGKPMPDDPEEDRVEGYCHFPMYGRDYFKQLTAEQRWAKRMQTGRERLVWVKLGANEALDCRVYARAAAEIHGLGRWRNFKWAQYERAPAGPAPPRREPRPRPAPAEQVAVAAHQEQPAAPRPRRATARAVKQITFSM